MSYVITVKSVALGEGLRQRAEESIRSQLAEARASEIDQVKDRYFRSAVHSNEAGLYAAVRVTEERARNSAQSYEKASARVKQAETLMEEAKPHQVEGAAAALINVRAQAKEIFEAALIHQKNAKDAGEKAKAAIAEDEFDFVGIMFDDHIRRGLDALVCLAPGIGKTKTVMFQIAGHIEDKTVGTGFFNVHVWPGEP